MVNIHSNVKGPLLSNILDIWCYRLYGKFFAGPTADHISGMYCTSMASAVGGGNPIAAASTDKLRYCDSERGRGGWVKKSEHFADVI